MNEERISPSVNEEERLSFSLSENEAEDTADSLDIKPPQAMVVHRKPTRHKKEKTSVRDSKHGYRKSSHSRNDERRKEYKFERSERDREVHNKDSLRRTDHRADRKERQRGERDHGRRKEMLAYRDERSDRRAQRDANSYQRQENDLAEDLRGKLLEKRYAREANSEAEPDRKRLRKNRDRPSKVKLVEEIQETEKEKEERIEREERRAKLLEAEREMALRKEVSRRELEARRERQILEKEKHRMLKEIAKKHKMEKEAEPKSEGEEGEIAEKTDEEESDDDTDSSSSSSSSEESSENQDTEEEAKGPSPESAPQLEKSPETPRSHPVSRTPSPLTSHHASPEPEDDPMEASHEVEEEAKVPDSPKDEAMDLLPPYLPAIQGCRSVEEFQCLNRIEEGTYGVVYRARDKRTSDIVALKRLKMEKEKEGFPITSLREINTLLKAQHPNIVTVREIVGSNMDKIFIVMDYVEHDLKSLMETMKTKKQVFVPGEIKCLMLQLLRAVSYLHDNWILHRDLKTSNLLLSHKGILKVGDFGLAREYGSPLKAYTPKVVTLWYRAPELLLQTKEYSTAIDVWSVGCIFGELLQMEALFPGESEMDQLNKMFKELGTPSEKVWPGISKLPAFQKVPFAEYPFNQIRSRFGTMLSDNGINLIKSLLTYDPTQRITAEAALKHDYFKEAPLPIDPAMFPTWPAKSEGGVKKVKDSPKPPSGGKAYKQLGDTDEVPSGGFHMGAGERRINNMAPGFSLKF